MKRLRRTAKIAHTRIKLHLLYGKWEASTDTLRDMLDAVQPDEQYHSLILGEERTSPDRQRLTMKAMAETRRLMRGALINVAIHLSNCTQEAQMRGAVQLSRIATESIERGLWDPWSLSGHSNHRLHQPLSIRMQEITPTSDLAALFRRLLGMCRPVQAIRHNQVETGHSVVSDGITASTYWSVMENLAEASKATKRRVKYLHDLGVPLDTHHGDRWKLVPFFKIFKREGSSGAQCIWSLFANKGERQLVTPRLRLLLYDVFTSLGVPNRVWTSAETALKIVKQGGSADMSSDVYEVFHEAAKEARMKGRTREHHENVDSVRSRVVKRRSPNYKARAERRRRKLQEL
ncbi:hypothetical protein CBS101457_002482 [Exobasidium rhododendri]|nr:hypothetical protein CBS101457_002482 [Exobasidium rhododendri]